MVYKKSNLRVLLGPEKPTDNGYDSDEDWPDTGRRSNGNESLVFEKIGETNVYKRIRPFQPIQPRPKLEKFTTHLQLAGVKMNKDDSSLLDADSEREEKASSSALSSARVRRTDPGDRQSDSPAPPGLRPRWSRYTAPAHGSRVSRFYMNDFGLKSTRTDTFSGHKRRRGVANSEIERQMEETASRHIRTCQVMGNVKRGSRAQYSYLGLKSAVAPVGAHSSNTQHMSDRSHHGLERERSLFARQDSSVNRHGQGVPTRRNVGTLPRVRSVSNLFHGNDPLPEISCRTLILGPS